MGIVTVLVIPFVIIGIVFSQKSYYDIFQSNLTNLNNLMSTVVVSSSKEIATCPCDLTPGVCDYLCCCDTYCSETTILSWKENPKNICLDKKHEDNSDLSRCFPEDKLYFYNRHKGIKSYRDPVSNLFCITFDNSSQKGNFYVDYTTLSPTTIQNVMANHILKDRDTFYYYKMDTGMKLNNPANAYSPGDYLKIRTGSSFTFDGKFLIPQSGMFGECTQTNPIRFMINNPKITCGVKLSQFSQCANVSWDSQIYSTITIADSNGSAPTYVQIRMQRVLIYDEATKTLSPASVINPASTSVSSQDGVNCTCNNVLKEITLIFMVSENYATVVDAYVEVVLSTNLKGICNRKAVMNRSYSTKFIKIGGSTYSRSGNPGYQKGKPLLIAYNSTSTDEVDFVVATDGLLIIGRNEDGTCTLTRNNHNNRTLSQLDLPVYFGTDYVYSCNLILATNDLESFCKENKWKEYVIYNQHSRIQYIGTVGNSNYRNLKDWTNVISDINYRNSTYYANNSTCTFPIEIYFDVLTSKAGYVNNPQEYIMAARLSATYHNVKIDNTTIIQQIPIRFITNFISISEDQLNQPRATNMFSRLGINIS